MALIALVMVAAGCAVLMLPVVHTCSQLGPCAVRVARAEFWNGGSAITMLLLEGISLVASGAWTMFLLRRTRLLVRQLPIQKWPVELREAVDRVGAKRIVSVAADVPLAFCAGALYPRIYISHTLCEHLCPSELDAVLLHEWCHSRRRDPLRLACAIALRDVCFYLPLLDWFVRYYRENVELRADRAAMGSVGRRSLAGALWRLGTVPSPSMVAAFAGAAELRTAQVLGDSLPCRRPDRSTCITSAVGVFSLLATIGCLVQVMLVR